MKIFHRIAGALAAVVGVGLIFGWADAAFGKTGAAGMATVVQVKGNARYSADGKTWHMLKKGDVLRPGCVIQTAEKSTVDLLLGAGPAGGMSISLDGRRGDDVAEPAANILRIVESTVLGIDKLAAPGESAGSETQLDLRVGGIIGSVGKLTGGSKYEIKIADGVAGVRGSSRYAISSGGMVRANSGSVVLVMVGTDGRTNTKVVTSGHRFEPQTGELSEDTIQNPEPYNPVKIEGGSSRPATSAEPGPVPGFRPALPSRNF